MEKLVIGNIAAVIALGTMLIVLVFVALQLYYSVKNEERISAFVINAKPATNLSFVDSLINIFYGLIKFTSGYLNKSRFFKTYAKQFNKYFIYIKTDKVEDIDYISFKFIILLLFQILYIICCLIGLAKFRLIVLIIVSIFAFFIIDIGVIINYQNKKKQIEEQLLQAIIIMNSAFKSGKNIMQAIEIVKEELSSPIKEEFQIVSKDISYGLSLYEAFSRFANRVKLEEAKYITSSLSLLSKTGGNIVTVFNMIERNFYDRLRIKNELNALTGTSRFLYRFLMFIPFVFISVIVLLNPTYFNPLLSSKLGLFLDLIMIAIYIIYLVIIRKIMKVDEVWEKIYLSVGYFLKNQLIK